METAFDNAVAGLKVIKDSTTPKQTSCDTPSLHSLKVIKDSTTPKLLILKHLKV